MIGKKVGRREGESTNSLSDAKKEEASDKRVQGQWEGKSGEGKSKEQLKG